MTEILLRVTVLLLAAVLVALVLRRSSAALRHLVWTLSLVGTLLIPLCSFALPGWQWAILPPRTQAPPAVAPADGEIAVGTRKLGPPYDSPQRPPATRHQPPDFSQHPTATASVAIPATPPTIAEHPSAVPSRPAWSWPVLLAAVWAFGSFLGLVWLAIGVVAAWHVARRTKPAADPSWDSILRELLGPCGIRRPIAVRECPQVSVPMTWGLWRPVILVPAGSGDWSAEIKRSVLLHELGHVRRGDCLMLLLGRLAGVAYWFHPLVWLAARQLRKTSEQAADDLVLASNVAPPDYAEHLVGIAAQMRGFRLFGHVALPMAGRSDLEGRVRAILDPRQNRGSLTRTSCYALVALAMLLVVPCALLRLGYAESKAVEKHPANAEGAAKAATTPMRFELTILGPDKQPVPRCAVEVRSDVLPTAASVQRGTFTKKSGNGAFLQADAAGSLVLDLPQEPMTFEVCIEQPGYGPYWAQWRSTEHREPVPARFVAELDAAWSVGGIVVDRQGKPIAGATVWPSVEFKKRPGDADELHFGKRLSTDAEGKWRFDSVPVSMKEVLVEIDHPGFQPNDAALPRGTFEIRPRGQPAAKIELQPGLTVAGKVTDEAGKPIAGALVRTRFCNHDREATTNISGDYQLTGCEPKMARIVVSAKGRALDLKEVLLAPDMGPLDFKTQPGGKIRVRVLDEKGNPAARACICVRELHGMWDCFAFDHIVRYADAGGVWQWDEAPLDEFKADICPPGGMQLQTQRLIARDEEYVFRTHPRLVISGSVVDAETRQPAKAFRVVPGVRADARAGRPGPARIDWSREDGYAANDGKYRIERDREETAHLVRIEADGYRVAVSRDIKSDEGKAHVDFALVKAQDVAAQILTPDGRPAAGAKIVIGIAAAQIVVKNGRIDRQTLAPQCEADESGRFQFPAQDGPYQLVIVHPAGFALRKSAEQEIPGTVTLTAWARVEGTFRVGAKTVSAALVDIQTNEIDSSGDGAPHIFTEHEATTGPDGRFVFERVFPGQGFIGRGVRLMADEGAAEVTSAVQIAAEFPAGKTTHIDLGGFGRQVLGKLAGPAGSHEKVLWQFARIDADADLPAPKMPAVPADVQGDPAREKAWWTAWKATAEGKAWLAEHEKYDKLCRASPNLFAKPDRDGAFRIDDVPPGSYVLSVDFDEHRAGRLSNYRFTVPPTAGNRTSEALDLGTLTLEKYQ